MVDMRDLKSLDRKVVWVRVPPAAHNSKDTLQGVFTIIIISLIRRSIACCNNSHKY